MPTVAAPAPDAKEATLLPGNGVATPSGNGLILPSVDRAGLKCLDPDSGKTLWESKLANKVLLATDERVFAQGPVKGKANQVKIVILNAKTGEEVKSSEPIVFPDWVVTETAGGKTFTSMATLEDGKLVYKWQAGSFYWGGARPTPEIEEAARKNAEGTFNINPDKATFEEVKGALRKPIAVQHPQKVTIGKRTYDIVDRASQQKGPFFQQDRFFRSLDPQGKSLWEVQIAAPVFIIPPP
jgi:hypothetical protein